MKIVLKCYKKLNLFRIWPKNPCVYTTFFYYFIYVQNQTNFSIVQNIKAQ
jgi:hypothetical protein